MSSSKVVGGEYDQRGEWERQTQAKASLEVSDEFVELVEWQRQKEKEAEAAKAAKAEKRREQARQRRQQAAKRREQAEEAKPTADTTDDRFRRQAEVATWLLGECVKYKRRAEEAERLLRAHGIID